MEWSMEMGKFERKTPTAPPMIEVRARLMEEVHEGYGIKCQGKGQIPVAAVTDTGCQTSTAGIDILKKMGIEERHLIPTCHRIIGITDTRLRILGVLMLEMDYKDRTTRQMVYVSSNSSGLYLSETACKELGLIDANFPECVDSSCAATTATKMDDSEDTKCKCIPRKVAPEKPEEIPFPPTEENVDKLKKWLLKEFEASAFNTCSHQPLKEMTGAPMDIVFKQEYKEHRVHTPIEVPHYWKYQVKEDLDKDVRLGIIEPVPQGTPTTWCTRMVVTAKKSGKPRRTVDLQKLKEATLRETHFTQTPFGIVSTTPSGTYKTVADAWNGYHSLPLAEGARHATTFITEWGRYRYRRAPQGYHASGDAYTRRFDDITSDFERVQRCVDDSLLWDASIEGAFWHTFEYLKHCTDNGIIFNEEKFVFAKKTCEFAGFELTPDGYRPTKQMLDSIRNFPTPKNIHDIRSWFGLVNQVAYAFSQAQMMSPFRDLLSHKNSKFYWDEPLNDLFEKSKEKIVELIKDGVRNFEKDRPTCLSTDWSKSGVGFTLTQKHCECTKQQDTNTYSPNCGNGHWKLILAGSRFTKPAESRYAPVEGEALAVAYGLNQCRLFVLGSPNLIVAVDHKPLIHILNDRALESIENPRLLRLKEKTLAYEYEIVHVPGKTNVAPDAMSRYPNGIVASPNQQDVTVDEEYTRAFAVLQSEAVPGSVTWDNINNASAHDEECIKLREVIELGFPATRDEVHECIKKYFQMRDEMYVIENAIFKGRKMLIPKSIRVQVLEGLHAAHQGVASMKANARDRFFWPGLDADLKQTRDQCQKCNMNAPSQPDEPMLYTTVPEMPFQQVVTDYYTANGFNYLIYADRFSGWTEVAKVANTSMPIFAKCVLKWFQTFGVPEEISSDGGPPYNSADYKSFLKTWGIAQRQSSAYYPQSNGRAESAVKSMKRCLDGNADTRNGGLDNEKVARAIMTHRNTPCQDTAISPAEMLYGYRLRDHLPNKFRSIRKEWSDVKNAQELRNSINQEKMNVLAERRSLGPLVVGDCVHVQNQTGSRPKKWSNTGRVVKVLAHRQYGIMIDGSRRVTLRNRKFLRRIKPARTTEVQQDQLPTDTVPAINRGMPPPIVVSNIPLDDAITNNAVSRRTRRRQLHAIQVTSPPAAEYVRQPLASKQHRLPTQVSTPPAANDTFQHHAEVTPIPATATPHRPPTQVPTPLAVDDTHQHQTEARPMPAAATPRRPPSQVATPRTIANARQRHGEIVPEIPAVIPRVSKPRALQGLSDHNKRGLSELPVIASDGLNAGGNLRRSTRHKRNNNQ